MGAKETAARQAASRVRTAIGEFLVCGRQPPRPRAGLMRWAHRRAPDRENSAQDTRIQEGGQPGPPCRNRRGDSVTSEEPLADRQGAQDGSNHPARAWARRRRRCDQARKPRGPGGRSLNPSPRTFPVPGTHSLRRAAASLSSSRRTTTSNSHCAALPAASVAVTVTRVLPTRNTLPEAGAATIVGCDVTASEAPATSNCTDRPRRIRRGPRDVMGTDDGGRRGVLDRHLEAAGRRHSRRHRCRYR